MRAAVSADNWSFRRWTWAMATWVWCCCCSNCCLSNCIWWCVDKGSWFVSCVHSPSMTGEPRGEEIVVPPTYRNEKKQPTRLNKKIIARVLSHFLEAVQPSDLFSEKISPFLLHTHTFLLSQPWPLCIYKRCWKGVQELVHQAAITVFYICHLGQTTFLYSHFISDKQVRECVCARSLSIILLSTSEFLWRITRPHLPHTKGHHSGHKGICINLVGGGGGVFSLTRASVIIKTLSRKFQ